MRRLLDKVRNRVGCPHFHEPDKASEKRVKSSVLGCVSLRNSLEKRCCSCLILELDIVLFYVILAPCCAGAVMN